MNILFLSYSGCIRVIKEGMALISRGHNVSFMQHRITNADLTPMLPYCTFYAGREHLGAKLKTMNGLDLIHVHNEPSWLGYVAKEARPDLPVVFDIHDLNMVRNGERDEDEVKSLYACDGLVFPSPGYRDFCLGDVAHILDPAYDPFFLEEKPHRVIYSMCNKMWMTNLPQYPRVNGIVYQGGLGVKENGGWEYRDYRDLAVELFRDHIPFHVYGSDMGFVNEYVTSGALVMPTLPYFDLLKNLTRYDWGFCGCLKPHPQLARAMPNKLFEYIAAGIPVLVMHADECAAFVEEHQIGHVIGDLSEIPDIYHLHHAYRKRVQNLREEFVMESQVEALEGLYQELGHGHG